MSYHISSHKYMYSNTLQFNYVQILLYVPITHHDNDKVCNERM